MEWKDLDHKLKVQSVWKGQYQDRKSISVAGTADEDADTAKLEPG